MVDVITTNQATPLAGVALRYPEKTFYLGQVFKDTTNSYKLVWFLAILSLLGRNKAGAFALTDLFTEMAVSAWHPVCLYRLSLGRQDKLQNVILAIQRQFGLETNAKPDTIRSFVDSSAETRAELDCFRRYVPTRFLAPWFAEKLRGTEDRRRDGRIQVLARESQRTPFASPYWFDDGSIRFNDSWRAFLVENMDVVQAFAEHYFALYLQARNPNVPGVVNKLRAPTERQLTAARQFWRLVQANFEKAGKSDKFRDIYSDRPLGCNFTIDHFLPWSFVAHDLLWNLTPVEMATNSSKNDVLPDLELYLPRLAKLHLGAVEVVKKRPKLLEDYTDCFKLDATRLIALGENDFEKKYRDVILPQAQVAMNQGFQSGWRMPSPLLLMETRTDAGTDAVPDDAAGLERREPIAATRVIELFPIETHRQSGSGWLPFYSLKVAAGAFLEGDAPEPEGWINAAKHGLSIRLAKGMFVTRVVGESMTPTIGNGAYCVFRSPVEGTRQGRVVLVQKRDIADPETGGTYTVKRYRSTKLVDENGWSHETIQLIPDNPDREKFPILVFTSEDDNDLRVIAEFIQMLAPAK
ncbi:MAG: hypothetical protein M1608_12700 [Candidatus Omnitrophica bacterium]|nr:hypothetical protein [Candidatus Omnitrophota bacterium]